MKLDKGTILSGITVVGTALAMLAMHGKGAIDALAGVPPLLNAWAAQMPLGVTSFGLAIALAMLVWLSAHRAHFTGPHYNPDVVAFSVAVLVMLAQQWAAGEHKPGALLTALWLGGIAGLLVPFLCRLIVGRDAPQ